MNEFLKLVENDDPNFKEKLINELTMARDDHNNKANDGFHSLYNGTYYGPHAMSNIIFISHQSLTENL